MALKINVGCGAHLIPGWVNIDRTPTAGALPGDATALPVATASAEAVVLLDVLEHLHPTREAPTAIAEAFRVLISGGVIRVSTPDLALLARAYGENKMLDHGQASQPGWYASVSAAAQFSAHAFGNHSPTTPPGVYDGHQALYDEAWLGETLRAAGFREVCCQRPRESMSESIRLEVVDRWPDTSLIMEGRRWV